MRRPFDQSLRGGWWPPRPAPAGAGAAYAAPRPSRVAPAARRLLKHPRLMPYHRLIAAVVLVNLGVLWHHLASGDWSTADGSALSGTAALTLVNVAAAVLIRQQNVLNALYGLAGRGSRSWPLWVRWSVSKVHHVGGIHAGAALAGTAWLCVFAAVATLHPHGVTATTRALAWCLVALMLLVVACAAPPVRRRAHDLFEASHRFAGWTSVGLFWALTVHLALHGRGEQGAAEALASTWQVWVLALLTWSVASPWLRLRRVPVTVERPSAHAAIVSFDHGVTPAFASGVAISRSPLRQWHAFASVSTPGRSGFRLLISRAGDWTGDFIDDPPSHVWVRGIPVSAPMAKASLLYERVVYLATGSGIGPILGQVLAERVPAKLVWSTRTPRATYGDALVDEVAAAQPDALIWDTTERGKPDLAQLALRACRDFGAEAVFVVSNQATTLRVVHELELLGVPAFGPIWDS